MGERSEKERIVLLWRSDQKQESNQIIFQESICEDYPNP